ncbi:hypothetical protein GFS60_06514 (plasmid) [Rhodococcus sp. WAY2]|nr:hypothetical protein GFS60_06514 [Rhodococcus sp. WAY2]
MGTRVDTVRHATEITHHPQRWTGHSPPTGRAPPQRPPGADLATR